MGDPLQNRLPPLVFVLGLGIAMWLVAPANPVTPLLRTGLALAAVLASVVFMGPALRAFVQAGTTVDPVNIDRASVLVTDGIYRVTRNPMYVAMALWLVAWALWLGGALVWAGPVFLVLWLDLFQIRPEERAMAAQFGAPYLAYKSRVRRWL